MSKRTWKKLGNLNERKKANYILTARRSDIMLTKISGCIRGTATFSITTLNLTTLIIKTISIWGLFATLSINDTQHNG